MTRAAITNRRISWAFWAGMGLVLVALLVLRAVEQVPL